MTNITVPAAGSDIRLGQVESRVYVVEMRRSTAEDILADDLAVGIRIGPVSVYVSVDEAESLAHALSSLASHIREAVHDQVPQA